MESWVELCQRHGTALLEDCAQSHLASWNGRVAGSFGRAGAFSFYPTKNLGAVGDGGALVSDEDALANSARVLRNYGQSVRYEHPALGLNSRLDELQAAILRVRLEWLDAFTARRREISAAYDAGIDNPTIELLAAPAQPESHVHHLYVLLCEQRDRLAAHLQGQEIDTLVHYPISVHQQPPCRELRRDSQGLPAAERHAKRCLSIPCHPQMSDADVARVIEEINAFR